ncbi:MAG: carboxypeptidase-like regulatory domain-containing protein [Bacteroidia bacterium]|nr:carboxypeptidase-like regulatory domain-containing protein [Bacteroidia bacterium]
MKTITKLSFLFLLFWGFGSNQKALAQTKNDSDLVQFTGFVVTSDSSKTIPFVTIRIKGTSRGTYSDMQGYFSFVAKRSDIIQFTCVGFVPKYFKMPLTSNSTKFKSVVAMDIDSFVMEEAVIIARPSAEQLDYMFSRVSIPYSDYMIAANNLRRKPLAEGAENLSNDGYTNAKWNFNEYANKAYYNGQPQPIPVLDVFAWGKFLKALEKGELKRK